MRKLIVFNMITLDGFFEGANKEIDWHDVDEEFNEFASEQLRDAGVLIFGRVTYQLLASYWPTAEAMRRDPGTASIMNTLPKVVFSTTLKTAEWNNTRLISTNVMEEIISLKNTGSSLTKDLFIFGSSDLSKSLMELDLIDEYRIMVKPVMLGSGKTLFNGLHKRMNLKHIKTSTFQSGNVLLCYTR